MVTLETLEGTIGGRWRYHYDVVADVLYLRLASAEGVATIGEMTDDGDILLHREDDDTAVGITFISWWKRFGTTAALPDSLREIEQRIAPLTDRIAA